MAVGSLVAGCGSGSGDTATGDTTTTEATVEPTHTTVYATGDSGMFVVEPVPEGWGINQAYTHDDGSGVYYAKGGDDDIAFSVLTFVVDPADPQVVLARQAMEDGESGITPIVVHGHEAYRMPLTDDGRTLGDQMQWFARPDLVVSVRAPWVSGLDVTTLAGEVHEISVASRDTLVVATTGGGRPGRPSEPGAAPSTATSGSSNPSFPPTTRCYRSTNGEGARCSRSGVRPPRHARSASPR